MRYATLAVGLLLLTAGCLGSPGEAGPGSTGSPSADPPTTDPADGTGAETATPECVEAVPTTVDPDRERVTPSPLPERLEELTEQSVAAYVESYETAHRRNLGLEADTEQYEVSTLDTAVESVDGGYVVVVEARYWYNAARVVENGTATVIHADGPHYRAAYFVSEDRMRRDSATGGDPVDARSGTVVECWR